MQKEGVINVWLSIDQGNSLPECVYLGSTVLAELSKHKQASWVWKSEYQEDGAGAIVKRWKSVRVKLRSSLFSNYAQMVTVQGIVCSPFHVKGWSKAEFSCMDLSSSVYS
jgi:hypothetical protein